MLVSCIMPTRGRPAFARAAVECFRAQTWPEKELVILDDEDYPSFSSPPEGTQYERLRRRLTIGAKRNLCISRASGDVICHWDDDDWSAPERIDDQMRRLLSYSMGMATGYRSMLFTDGTRWWRYVGGQHYALGTSLMYWRPTWLARPFQDRNEGEDNSFVGGVRLHLSTADAGRLMVARIHSGNTSVKNPGQQPIQWRPVEAPVGLEIA